MAASGTLLRSQDEYTALSAPTLILTPPATQRAPDPVRGNGPHPLPRASGEGNAVPRGAKTYQSSRIGMSGGGHSLAAVCYPRDVLVARRRGRGRVVGEGQGRVDCRWTRCAMACGSTTAGSGC